MVGNGRNTYSPMLRKSLVNVYLVITQMWILENCRGCNADKTGLGSHPVFGFCVSGVETEGSAELYNVQ
jgi:hypothetical protein